MDAPFTTTMAQEQGPVQRGTNEPTRKRRLAAHAKALRLGLYAPLLALLLGACTNDSPLDSPLETMGAGPPAAPVSAPSAPSPVSEALARPRPSGPLTGADVVARDGSIELTVADLPSIVDASRALQIWRSGVRPPESALSNLEVRLQLLDSALDARLVHAEVALRGLTPTPGDLEPLLALAQAGLAPDAVAPTMPVPMYVGAAFEARYLISQTQFARLAQDVLEASRLRDALLAEMTDEALQPIWRDQKTRVQIQLVHVGRVPSTREIDVAVLSRPMELQAWYDAHPELFVTPAKRTIRRVIVDPVGQDPAARAAATAFSAASSSACWRTA